MFISPWLREIVEFALKEDIGMGDITSESVISPNEEGTAEIIVREEGVIAGLEIAKEAFKVVDDKLEYKPKINDGERVKKGDVIVKISGNMSAIMLGERTALNFLQHLSGIATLTSQWVSLIKEYPAQLVDTRKTTPGLRQLEKYAVVAGGGRNHRLGLHGGVLIKENHIKVVGGIKEAVLKVKKDAPITLRIEVEVTTLEELEEALEAGADLVMLDNMDEHLMKKAVEFNRGRAYLEASGNITQGRLQAVAATGVDYISSGALTHSSTSLDLSMLVKDE